MLTQAQLLGEPLFYNFVAQKTCKNRCDFQQFSSLSANISGIDKVSDKI